MSILTISDVEEIKDAVYCADNDYIECQVLTKKDLNFALTTATKSSINQYANDLYQKIIDDGIEVGEHVSG